MNKTKPRCIYNWVYVTEKLIDTDSIFKIVIQEWKNKLFQTSILKSNNISNNRLSIQREKIDLSVNLSKPFRANTSNDKQETPTACKASSLIFRHCSFRTFNLEHPFAMASKPLLLMNSESSERDSRDLQWDPTVSNEISVIPAQAAIPSDFKVIPHPRTSWTSPVSVNPSQNRKFKSWRKLQYCPTAAKPSSPM